MQPNPYCGTAITEEPTFAGPAGRAWRVRLNPIGERGTPDFDATVGIFIVRVPGAHVFWDHWAVAIIHLRPIPDVRPPVIKTPGATHEFMIVALNPESPLPSLDAKPGWSVDWLRPIDVVEQFAATNDVVADRILELAVHAIVDGHLSPDQDWRAWWRDAIASTAQHYADGTHSVGRPA